MLERVRKLLDAGRSIGEIATLAKEAFPDTGALPPGAAPSRKRSAGAKVSTRRPRGKTAGPASTEIDSALARCVLEALPHGVVVTDVHGKTEWINEGITDLCGYTLADMAGRTPGSVLQGPESDQRAVRRMAAAVAARRACSERLMNYDSRNRPYMAAVDIAPLWVGQRLRGFVGLIRDLTKEGSRRGG
jgi:PAS domain S-box-containing protein